MPKFLFLMVFGTAAGCLIIFNNTPGLESGFHAPPDARPPLQRSFRGLFDMEINFHFPV